MRIFILGAGYSARAYARLVAADADALVGTTRTLEKSAVLREAGIDPIIFDGSVGQEMAEALAATTHLVASAAPSEAGDPLLRALPGGLRAAMPALRWAGYLSTVGVYGDHQGAWVDETSETRPKSRRSIERVAAEQAWLAAGRLAEVPVAVLRLSGIYGPGRNAFVNLARGTAHRTIKPGQVFNRIHVADIAGSLAFLGARRIGGIFNVTDDEPGPPQDVITYAASLMQVAAPPETPFDQVEMSPMARSFWSDNKRVSNALIRKLGYVFRYPNHRLALEAIWRDGSWRGSGTSVGDSDG